MNKSDEEKMLENLNAVIFDVDGTIADSMWMWKEIDIEGITQFPEDVVGYFVTATDKNGIRGT